MTVPALVYTREEFARALGMGLSSFERLRKRDKTMPSPLRLAGPHDRPRWLRTQVERWLEQKARSTAEAS